MSGVPPPPAGATAAPSRAGGAGWRRLGVFWVVVLALLAGGAGVLQWLGPARPGVLAPAPGRTGGPAGPAAGPAGAGMVGPPAATGTAAAPTAGGASRAAGSAGASPAGRSASAAPGSSATEGTRPPAGASGAAAIGGAVGSGAAGNGAAGRGVTGGGGTNSSVAATGALPAAGATASGGTPAAPGAGPFPPAPSPVAAPEADLSEPAPDFPGHRLPRVGADGRTPMAAYASAFDVADPRPRVGLILAGVGLDRAASLAAIRALPAGVTLAVSPYAADPAPLLAAARAAGHEYLVSIPMEPERFPLNDPGNHALLTRQTPAQNRRQLDWALSRFAGYVGATGALGVMRGERFAGSREDMDPVLRRLARCGLLYVDPRPAEGRLPFAWGRGVDVVIDHPAGAAAIDAALARLDRIAQRRGRALGLVGAVRPVAVAQLAAWANGLAAHGLALAPVTALALPPPKPTQAGGHP